MDRSDHRDDIAEREEWGESGRYEWEYERRLLSDFDGSKLAEYVALAVRGDPEKGHAYTANEIASLRDILDLSGEIWSDETLHRHTDELAVFVGLRVRSEVPKPISERRESIEEVVSQAKLLQSSLERGDLSWELFQSKTESNVDRMSSELPMFIEGLTQHCSRLKDLRQKGKKWDSDLKYYFVEMVTKLCEYLNSDFEPSRNMQEDGPGFSQFADAVQLLSGPIFDHNPGGSAPKFSGATREIVDSWNENKRTLIKEAVAKKV